MTDFTVEGKVAGSKTSRVRMALRRMRPPEHVRVDLHATKPAYFRNREDNFGSSPPMDPGKPQAAGGLQKDGMLKSGTFLPSIVMA